MEIIKHELTHLYTIELVKGHAIPKWLNEGLANYFAKQNQKKKNIYIEKNFCKGLSTPSGWNKNVDDFAYEISTYFVAFLLKEYSFNKIKELIASLDKNFYYPSFKEIFKKIYKKDLEDVESDFIKTLNK